MTPHVVNISTLLTLNMSKIYIWKHRVLFFCKNRYLGYNEDFCSVPSISLYIAEFHCRRILLYPYCLLYEDKTTRANPFRLQTLSSLSPKQERKPLKIYSLDC